MPPLAVYKFCLSFVRPALICCFWLTVLGRTATAQFKLDLFTTEHGLPQNTINAITQTRDGYLWLATYDGLARYDGARFVVFDRATQSGIRGNRFSALYEDRAGNLWAGTEEGFLTRHRAGQFTTFAPADPLANHEIRRIEEDDDGNLWAITTHSVVRWRNGQPLVYDPRACLSGLSIFRSDGRRGRIWWSQDAAGLHLFRRGRLLTYRVQDVLPNLRINSVTEDLGGMLWVASNKGAINIEDHRMTVFTTKEGLPSTDIGDFEDQQEDRWMMEENGARRLRDGVRLEMKGFNECHYQDREGTLWIGASGGLYRVRRLPITGLAPRSGIGADEWISTVLQTRAGEVWVGGWGGGLSLCRGNVFSHHTGRKELFSRQITALYEDRNAMLWVGTLGGVSQFKDGSLRRFSDQHGLNEVFAMREDRAGNFWFATKTGLTKLRDGVFTRYTTRDGLPHDDVKVILEDSGGVLWFGTHDGLARLANGRFTAYNKQTGFKAEHIRELYEDADGALWIGTSDAGLHRFKDGRFTAVTTGDGLFNNGVFRILEDRHGYFWMSCNLGIYRVRRQELNDFAEGRLRSVTSVPYGVKDGMPIAECNGGRQPAGWQMHDGRLWFPTQNGVAVIDPEAIPINRTPPPVVIETVRANREPLPFGEEARVPPGRNHLEIEFTGLSFLKPEHVRFRYRLTGLESDWVEAGNRRTAYYSPLAPGDYTFTVIAANSDGVWNTTGRSLRIVVEPSWWQTWWFKTIAVLSLIGLGFAVYRQHSAQSRRRRAEREQATRRLLASLEEAQHRIAKDLHDDLSGDLAIIKNRALHALGKLHDPEITAEHLAEITETAGRISLEMHEIIYDLYPVHLDRRGLAKVVAELADEAARSGEINFTVELEAVDELLTKEARIHLYRIIREGINNILKHAQATAAQITLKREAASLLLTIADNGRGVVAEMTRPTATQGFGLEGMAERARLLGGEFQLRSTPGQGTVITIQLKAVPDQAAR